MIILSDLVVGDIIQDSRAKYGDEWRIMSIDGDFIRVECLVSPLNGFPIEIGSISFFRISNNKNGIKHYIIKSNKPNNFNSLYDKLL